MQHLKITHSLVCNLYCTSVYVSAKIISFLEIFPPPSLPFFFFCRTEYFADYCYSICRQHLCSVMLAETH